MVPQVYAEWVDISPKVEISKSPQALDRVNRVLFSYVTITNNSAEALDSPVRLHITNPTISVLNADGITNDGDSYFQIPANLADGDKATIRVDFQLARVKLAFGTQVQIDQYVNIPTITNINPSDAISGELVSIEGIGFTPNSQVWIGDHLITDIRYSSQDKISIVVPYTEENAAIAGLPAGEYPLRVDGSLSSDFAVSALPANPNLPGAVLGDAIQTITDGFRLHRIEIESAITESQETASDPAIIEYLNTSKEALPIIDRLLTDLPLLAKSMDPATLATLEKTIWALTEEEVNQNIASKSIIRPTTLSLFDKIAVNVNNTPRTALNTLETMFLGRQAFAATNDVCISVECGDAWLDGQKGAVTILKTLEVIEAGVWACSVFNPFCKAMGTITTLSTDSFEFSLVGIGRISGIRILSSDGLISSSDSDQIMITLSEDETTELSVYIDTVKGDISSVLIGRAKKLTKLGIDKLSSISKNQKETLNNLIDVKENASKATEKLDSFSSKVSYPISFSRLNYECEIPGPEKKEVSNGAFLKVISLPDVGHLGYVFKCETELQRKYAQTLLQTLRPASYSVNFIKEILPTVSIIATDSISDESGTNTGTFTFYRDSNSDTSAALSIDFTVSGTATNGSDYRNITSPIVIPAGSYSAELIIAPTSDDDGITETVIINIDNALTYTIDLLVSSAEVTIDSVDERFIMDNGWVLDTETNNRWEVGYSDIEVCGTQVLHDGGLNETNVYCANDLSAYNYCKALGAGVPSVSELKELVSSDVPEEFYPIFQASNANIFHTLGGYGGFPTTRGSVLSFEDTVTRWITYIRFPEARVKCIIRP